MLMKGNLLVDWVSLKHIISSGKFVNQQRKSWQARKLFHSLTQSVPEILMKICQIKMFSQQLRRVNELIYSTSQEPAHARVSPQSLKICCLREEWANFFVLQYLISLLSHFLRRITYGRRNSSRAHVDSPVCLVFIIENIIITRVKRRYCDTRYSHTKFLTRTFFILLLRFTAEWRWL